MVVETMVGVAATAALGAVGWMVRSVNQHNHEVKDLPRIRTQLAEHSLSIMAITTRQEERHAEVKEDFKEVKETLASLARAVRASPPAAESGR